MGVKVQVTFTCDNCKEKKADTKTLESGYEDAYYLIYNEQLAYLPDGWTLIVDRESHENELLCEKCAETKYPESRYGVWLG